MRTFRQLIFGLRNRSRIIAKKTYLYTRWRAKRQTIWIDYGWMRLPFHGDGDKQEVYYHLNGKQWWEDETAILSRYMKHGDVAIDVGANLGFLTGVLSKLVQSKGQVHSFEPSPTTYAKLDEVIHANRYDNVSTYNVGCGESEGRMTLHRTASSGDSTLHSEKNCYRGIRSTQEVRIVRLDNFLEAKFDRLDFLKIDTEGFEDCVLAGAIGLLQKFKPIIYIELTTEYLKSSQRAVKILLENGYIFEREPRLERCHLGENFIAFHESKRALYMQFAPVVAILSSVV
jgi:FkbM family methyltransferase